jgi:hypothetical protein
MLAVLYFILFEICGVLIVQYVLPKKPFIYRLWLGMVFGILLIMWLPALAAFFISFSTEGHIIALFILAAFTFTAYKLRDNTSPLPFDNGDIEKLKTVLIIAIPLSILCAYLLHTHVLRPVGGALHVGQSTYGDLPLHLSIATSLKNAKFPAAYNIFPPEKLSYPFLMDSLSTSFLLFSSSLRFSIIFPAVIMAFLVFSGFVLFAMRISNDKRAVLLAALLLFINGGLGFLYPLDMAGVSLGEQGSNELQNGIWFERLSTILNGFYQTPANHAEFSRYNLRWSNIIVDMLIPQRTFLAGWTFLFPCMYLLYDFMSEDSYDIRQIVLLGIISGAMPLIHTHSFLALVLLSFAWLIVDLVKRKRIKPWLIYVFVAGVLSIPQLFAFTFEQSSSSGHFLSFQFNWVNVDGGMKDYYLWFYIKNIGLPFIFLILSLFEKNNKWRFIYIGAFAVFLPAEFIRFQPNIYDNNKLFYVWYALCVIPISEYIFSIYDSLKKFRSRKVLAVLCTLIFFLTGTLSIAREINSDYMMFSSEDVELSKWVIDNTEKDDTFICGTQHINPVSNLAGRNIVCGPASWLYYHGFNISEREMDIYAFYVQPENHKILDKYGVDYIFLSPHEIARYDADLETFDSLYNKVYSSSSISVYEAKND